MHNFELSDEHQMVLETVHKFVTDVAEPQALDCDEHGRFVRAQIEQLGELGMLGLPIAEADGGAGMGYVATVVALEEIASACSSTARVLAMQAGVCGAALSGLPEGKALLGELAGGAKLAAWVGPEHGITAKASGAGCTLDGRAEALTAVAECDVLLVAAKLDGEAVLVSLPRSAAKVSAQNALGFRAAAPGAAQFSGAAATILARGAEATAACERASTAACVTAAAIACGLAQASHRATKRHAGERIAFGKPLSAQQAVAHKLVEMQRRAQAARHATYHAARLLDAGQDAREAAWLAKIEAVEAAVFAADEGIQVHGGYGYVVEYHVERHYRDAKMLEVCDVGLEVLRDRLACASA